MDDRTRIEQKYLWWCRCVGDLQEVVTVVFMRNLRWCSSEITRALRGGGVGNRWRRRLVRTLGLQALQATPVPSSE
eukprot:COSAG02_NODE_398_length_23118_cov_49.968939_25_plen_76_part_00